MGRGGSYERAGGNGREFEESARRGRERSESKCAEPAVRRISLAADAAICEHELVQRAQFLWRLARYRSGDNSGRAELFQNVLRAEQCGAGDRGRFRTGTSEAIRREIFRQDCGFEIASASGFDGAKTGKRK